LPIWGFGFPLAVGLGCCFPCCRLENEPLGVSSKVFMVLISHFILRGKKCQSWVGCGKKSSRTPGNRVAGQMGGPTLAGGFPWSGWVGTFPTLGARWKQKKSYCDPCQRSFQCVIGALWVAITTRQSREGEGDRVLGVEELNDFKTVYKCLGLTVKKDPKFRFGRLLSHPHLNSSAPSGTLALTTNRDR